MSKRDYEDGFVKGASSIKNETDKNRLKADFFVELYELGKYIKVLQSQNPSEATEKVAGQMQIVWESFQNMSRGGK